MRNRVAAIALVASALHAQPAFEAASIKPLEHSGTQSHFTVLPNRLDVKSMNLQYLIKQAFDLHDDQIAGPAFLMDRHFDIIATTSEPISKAVMRTMLLNLLVDRFHLATHWTTRSGPMYRLEVSAKGRRMKAAEQGQAVPNSPSSEGGAWRLDGPMSMQQLADRLTLLTKRPVVDATKLDGYFMIALQFASEDPSDSASAAPLLPTAIQEQLGLKLVPAKDAIKILIIDHADFVPTAN